MSNASRTLSVRSPAIPLVLGLPALEPVRLSGHEGLDSLFAYELLLKTPDALNLGASGAADFDLDGFIGREIACSIELDDGSARQINALITDAGMWGEEGRHVQYKLTLRPWLHLATLRTDCRIFQNKTVVEVLDELLAGYAFPVDKRLFETYPVRDYQTQFNESDFQFFERLCQEWGISYHFEHSEGKHRLVLCDAMGAYRPQDSAIYREVEYHAPGWKLDAEYIHSFVPSHRLTSGRYATKDYDYTRIGNAVQFIAKNMSAVLPAAVLAHLRALPSKLEVLRPLGAHKLVQAIKDLNELLNRLRQHLIDGTWANITVGTSGTRVMTEEARLAELARDMGASLGHTAASEAHYVHKDHWTDLRDPKFDRGPPIPTFSVKASIEAITQRPGAVMVRVVDTAELGKPWTIPGRFWTTHLPSNGTAWRTQCAVKHKWSKNGSYVEMKVPTAQEMRDLGISVPLDWEGMRVWRGRIAEQLDNEGTSAEATMRIFPGGDIQFFVDFDHAYNAPIREWISKKIRATRTHWVDVWLPNQKQAQALMLAERERSAKIRLEGYALRGTAITGKQANEEPQ
ncbi:type VI secretion system Vgr family protein [Variovorax sp. GB1P17]|uniref:type VI secretion system Vgr family protein n=1 Tax=Variovorax sp. GB1P17 TaxID=3443740 RepID=UPI003F4650F4